MSRRRGLYQLTIDGYSVPYEAALERKRRRAADSADYPVRDEAYWFSVCCRLYALLRLHAPYREDIYAVLARCTRYNTYCAMATELYLSVLPHLGDDAYDVLRDCYRG